METNLQVTLTYMEELRKAIEGIASEQRVANPTPGNAQELKHTVDYLRGTLYSIANNIQQYNSQYGIFEGYNAEMNSSGLDDLIEVVAKHPEDYTGRHETRPPNVYASGQSQERYLGLPNISRFTPVSPVTEWYDEHSILQEELRAQRRQRELHYRQENHYSNRYEDPEQDGTGLRSISDLMDVDQGGSLHSRALPDLDLRYGR